MKEEKKPAPAYEPKDVEHKIYAQWESAGYFNPDALPGKRTEPYSIMIAPPNVTGSLHMGHALEDTGVDVLVRYHRMAGFKTLWVPGTDHAAIALNNVIEKELKKQGLSRHDLGKEKFIEKVWEYREKYGDIILNQLRMLGCSCDWSRTEFTMNPGYQKAVKIAFEHYKEKGLIYQGERVINWCIKDQTALSDLELEYEEETSKLWFLKYPVKDSGEFVVVATTRPETMLGDTAVAVNAKDARYAHLIGKTVVLPITGREVPIIADHTVEMEFGTGAVKVTPAHDFADSDTAERNNLPYLKVINEVGKIVNVGEGWDGLKIAEAREKVVATPGLVEKEEALTHNVAKCYRCGSTIEPMLSKQWFLKMKPLAEKVIAAIETGKVKYVPERWTPVALNWLENIRDWCVSRQIWWGHPIPIEGSTDTFDTWFSAALWPFAALGWPDKKEDLSTYYPTSAITSGRDILHLWIARMIFSGLEFMDEVPFREVFVHATVLTKDGKRMSKSLGTGIDPLVLIDKYGADATRFGLMYQALGGQDVHFNEDVLVMGKKFCNKLWNINRFSLQKIEGNSSEAKAWALKSTLAEAIDFTKESAENRDILEKLELLVTSTNARIKGYDFGQAAHELYDFAWHDFADVFIEASKKSGSEETARTVALVHVTLLKLLHPFMPFITEEMWAQWNAHEMLIVTAWPK